MRKMVRISTIVSNIRKLRSLKRPKQTLCSPLCFSDRLPVTLVDFANSSSESILESCSPMSTEYRIWFSRSLAILSSAWGYWLLLPSISILLLIGCGFSDMHLLAIESGLAGKSRIEDWFTAFSFSLLWTDALSLDWLRFDSSLSICSYSLSFFVFSFLSSKAYFIFCILFCFSSKICLALAWTRDQSIRLYLTWRG